MKRRMSIKVLVLVVCMCILETISVSAQEPENVKKELVSEETRKIVLQDLRLNENELSKDDEIALFGTGVVWKESFNTSKNLKKQFSMTALLTSTSKRPYTTVTVANTGKSKITVSAYKGTVGGSTSLGALTVYPGHRKSMTITRTQVISHGTMNAQGTTSSLAFTVSVFNSNGEKYSGNIEVTKYD